MSSKIYKIFLTMGALKGSDAEVTVEIWVRLDAGAVHLKEFVKSFSVGHCKRSLRSEAT
jgi:hypothetical protein